METKNYRFETLQIHAGLQPDEATGARGVAIYPTAAYRFKSCDQAAKLFELSEAGNIYTRLQNPTTTAYEQRIAALYGAVGALAVSSGMSAILVTVLSLAAEGDNIVASPFLYGGTYNQFRITLRKLGIDCRIASGERPEDFEALIDDRTKALYAESMGNPTCAVPDLEGLGNLAGGAMCRWSSTTRSAPPAISAIRSSGVRTSSWTPRPSGSTVTARGWAASSSTAALQLGERQVPADRRPLGGVSRAELPRGVRPGGVHRQMPRGRAARHGCAPSPFDSYLMMIGLETLSLRVKHEVESARKLAEYCRCHPKVERVSFVGFDTHPSHENARKYYRFGSSAVFNVELKGTLESTVRFVESLRLAANMVMIGDSITVVTHPASTTHRQLSDADLAAAA